MRRRAFVAIAMFAALVAAFVATNVSATPPPLTPKAADLFAGQTTDVGDIYVWSDATNVHIEIVLDAGWCMTESHVAAATTLAGIPQTSKGNPIPGQFPQGGYYSPCEQVGDTFEFPIAGPGGVGTQPYIAVHAKVWEEAVFSTMNVYSDNLNTQVIPPLGLPFPAVDAWEAFGNPPDPTPSVWDTGVGIGTFQFADWIWQSYRVQTPTVDETVTFKREFTPPGPVAPGSWMKVTTDDEYTATLNGTQVAADVWPNWPSVETASPFDPVSGLNTLLFVAVNSNKSYGPDGTIDNNPGGLIYEAGINYFTHSESAWAGTAPYTTDFPGANWATYFQFLGNPTLNTCPTIPGTYYANFELSGSNVAWPPSGEMAACLIPNDVTVNGNIKMTGGTLRVNGHVNGNMEQSGDGGGLVVQNGAVVVGNLTENGAGFLRIDDNANVTGTVTEYGDGDIAMTVTALVTGNLFEWGNGNITLGGTSHVQGDATENGPGFVTVAATASVSGTITNNP